MDQNCGSATIANLPVNASLSVFPFFSRGSRFSTNGKTKRFMIPKSTTLYGKICKTLNFNRLMHNLYAYPLLIIKINTCFFPCFKLWQCCKGKNRGQANHHQATSMNSYFLRVQIRRAATLTWCTAEDLWKYIFPME